MTQSLLLRFLFLFLRDIPRNETMPRTLGPTVLVTAFTLVSLSTVVVAVRYVQLQIIPTWIAADAIACFRFYCRHFLVRAVRIYDHLMLLALVCSTAFDFKCIMLTEADLNMGNCDYQLLSSQIWNRDSH